MKAYYVSYMAQRREVLLGNMILGTFPWLPPPDGSPFKEILKKGNPLVPDLPAPWASFNISLELGL